ncbi:MAG: Ig-like domain repeat protein, partial [Candidatus Angelobacter sp.]
LSGGQATFSTSALGGGSHSITAAYSGDTTFDPSTSTAVVQNVNLTSTTTAVVSSPNPSNFDQAVAFTVTVTSSSGTPTGAVVLFDGPTSLGPSPLDGTGHATASLNNLPVGSNSITAVYQGDSKFAGSTSTAITQTVNVAPTTTALGSSANPSIVGQAVTFTATVSSTGTATGSVTFKDGAATIGTGGLDANGQATFSTSSLALGSQSITASYASDGNFAGSTSSVLTQTVNKAATTTVIASSINPSLAGQSVTFTATVSSSSGTPAGSVTFLDGATSLGVSALSAGQATFSTSSLAAGSHSITAAYAGTATFTASTSAALSQTVNKAVTTMVVASSANPVILGQSVTFTATVSSSSGTPTGSVSFFDGATTLGSAALSAGTATFSTSSLALGSHAVTAGYQGNATFAGSTSAAVTQAVNSAALDFSIGAPTGGSTSITIKAGQPASYSLQLALSSGVSTDQLSVTVTCSGAPAKATCIAPATPVIVTGAAPVVVPISVSTTANAFALPMPPSEPRGPVNLLPMLATMALFSLVFWIVATAKVARKHGAVHAWTGRLKPGLAMKLAHAAPVLLLFVTMAVLSGCGGGGGSTTPPPPPPPVNNGTPAGTYTLTVTAVSGSVTHTQPLTLTVQ